MNIELDMKKGTWNVVITSHSSMLLLVSYLNCHTLQQYIVELLVHGEKEHSNWFPERSVFCYTDRSDGPLKNCFLDLCF